MYTREINWYCIKTVCELIFNSSSHFISGCVFAQFESPTDRGNTGPRVKKTSKKYYLTTSAVALGMEDMGLQSNKKWTCRTN